MPTDLTAGVETYPQFVRKYLSVAPRTVLFSARVDGVQSIIDTNTPDDFGVWLDIESHSIYMLHYDTETGVAADCDESFTIEIGSSLGKRDIGIMALRDTIDTVNKRIPVSETPFGQVPVRDNYFISIIKEVRPQQRVVRLVATERASNGSMTNFVEYHNYDEAYVNQNHEIVPIANINTPSANPAYRLPARAAGWADPITGFFRVVLTSEFSRSMNGNTVTPTWSIDDCTLVGMGATLNDVEITIDCPSGWRLIKLVVVDDVTGIASPPRYHPIFSHDDDFMPIEAGTRGFAVTSDEREDGRRMAFDIIGQDADADETIFPRGAQVVYWEEPYFGGEEVSELYIRDFIGWIKEKEFDVEKHGGSLNIKVWGVEGWGSALNGFSTQLNDEGRLPNTWFIMEDILVEKAIHYIFREYSTMLYCSNLYLPTTTRHDKAEAINKSKLFDQAKTIAGAFGYTVAVDSGNGIDVREDTYFRQDGGAGVNVIRLLTADNIVKEGGLKIVEAEEKQTGVIDGTGSKWDGVSIEPEIFASRAPGKYAGEGDGSESFFWRVDSQEHLNFLVGQLYARVNSRFRSFSLTLIDNMDIFEKCWNEFLLIDYDEPNLTSYGIVDSTRFLIKKISVAHSNDVGTPRKQLTLELEEYAEGEDGEYIKIEDPEEFLIPNPEPITFDNQSTLPPFQLDLEDYPVADFTPEPTAENPTPDPMAVGFAISHVTKKLLRSFHFLDESVIWEDITPPGENGTLIDYKAIYGSVGDTMHCYAVYHSIPGGTGEGVFTFWKCDAKTKPVVWTEEDVHDVDGTGFSGHGSIDFDDTTQLAAFAALSEDGVRVIRKEIDNWSDNGWEVIGSDAFTDDTVADRDIQLVVDGDKITVCGATGNQEYQLFQATGETGPFAAITDTPTFYTPVNSLTYKGTELYAAAWNADGEGGAGGGDGNEYEEHTNSLSDGDCVSEDPIIDDFTSDDGGWVPAPSSVGDQAVHTPGIGWEDVFIQFVPNNAYRVVAINKVFDAPVTATDFSMDFLYTQGFVDPITSDVSIFVALDGNILIQEFLPTVPISPAVWSGIATGTVLQVVLIAGYKPLGDPGGTATITNIEYTLECSSEGIADPTPETSNSASFFGPENGGSLGLEWDAVDDDPKQFDGFDGGFFETTWNFDQHEDKKLLGLEWFLNIKYTSDQNDTPPGAVLRCRYKITMKEEGQPPDFTEGELKFTVAASTLTGSGPYERLVTSLNMLTGLDFEGVQLEYLKCRVDVILPAINLYSPSEGETTAHWRIYTTPYGESGSPAVTYGQIATSGSLAFRCDDYKTAPVWTDITPVETNSDAGSAGRCAKYKYGIAVDAITATTIYMCGFDEVNGWIIKSVDSGDNWTAVEGTDTKWLFVSDTTFLTGGEDSLVLAMNGLDNQVQRIGDMTRFGEPVPAGHTEVLTGFS